MTYHYVKFYASIIIYLIVININVRNFNYPIGFYSNPHLLWTPQNISITPPSFMKFCPVVPEICCGQVHGSRKERKKERKRKRRSRIIIIIIIIRNGAKTISLQTLFGRLNNSFTLVNLQIFFVVCLFHMDQLHP